MGIKVRSHMVRARRGGGAKVLREEEGDEEGGGGEIVASIPAVLLMLDRAFRSFDGLKSEGIFRVAPDKTKCEMAKTAIDRGTFQAEDYDDVNIFSKLIKVQYSPL